MLEFYRARRVAPSRESAVFVKLPSPPFWFSGALDQRVVGCYLGVTNPGAGIKMSTTTLKLPDSLKARIAPLAEAAGKTPHAWMVDALEAQAALAEMREAFIAEGEAAAAELDAGGPLYAAEDVHAYIVARATGKAAPRPRPMRRSSRR